MITLIAALGARNRAIGKDGDLVYRLPEDMKHFTDRTMGHPVIMGKPTWESIPKGRRPLEGRSNIILTRDTEYTSPSAWVVHSMQAALELAREFPGAEEIFIIGGGKVYEEALAIADQLDLTLIDADKPGDVFFPDYADTFTRELSREEHVDEKTGIHFEFVRLARPSSTS